MPKRVAKTQARLMIVSGWCTSIPRAHGVKKATIRLEGRSMKPL